MAGSASTYRRDRTWKIRYTSRVNECYWKKIHKRRERSSTKAKCFFAFVVLVLSISPVFLPIEWGTAIVSAVMTFLATLVGVFFSNTRTAKVDEYCRQWSDLYHSADSLWDEGEKQGWNRRHMEVQVERLNSKCGEYQRNEKEDPDNDLVEQCEKEFYRNLNAVFPPKGESIDG